MEFLVIVQWLRVCRRLILMMAPILFIYYFSDASFVCLGVLQLAIFVLHLRFFGLARTHAMVSSLPLQTVGTLLDTSKAYVIDAFNRKAHVTKRRGTFRFKDLPLELRTMVYEKLLDGVTVLPPRSHTPQKGIARHLPSFLSPRPIKWGIMLANKQLYSEFMAVALKQATFMLHCGADYDQPWLLTPATLRGIEKLDLQITVTAEMLGLPRLTAGSLNPSEAHLLALPFRQHLTGRVAALTRLRAVSVHVQAVPAHLWNPVFIWLFTLQLLKESGIAPLREVTFGIWDWAPSKNGAIRGEDGRWRWKCANGHVLGEDPTEDMNIRRFCLQIFQQCRECLAQSDPVS